VTPESSGNLARPPDRGDGGALLPGRGRARECAMPGGRLVLVPFEERHARDVARHLGDPRIAQTYLARPAALRRQPLIEASFARRAEAGASVLVACRKSEGDVVGGIHVWDGCLSYFIAAEHWARGYGGEMVETYCRLVWPEIGAGLLEAHVLRENVASRRILERAGFRFAGLYPQALPAAPFRLPMLFYTL
jgi:RimJ/RimL family protein N-acetyltransferase